MIEVRNLLKTSEACPTQWTADADEHRILIRYRWGNLEVYDLPQNGARGNVPTFEKHLGDWHDGHMETEVMKNLLDPVYRFL